MLDFLKSHTYCNIFSLLLLLCFLLYNTSALTQNLCYSLNIVDSLSKNISSISNPSNRSTYFQQLAILGAYDEIRRNPRHSTSETFSNKKESENLVPFSALEFLEQVADNYDIIVLNEDHISSNHRQFLEDIVLLFKDYNYDILAIEAMDYSDTSINSRKYPITTTGYYSQDPVFSNAMRVALNNDYELLPFDLNKKQRDSLRNNMISRSTDGSISVDNSARYKIMSKNIKNIIENSSGSKIIVYCGNWNCSKELGMVGNLLAREYKVLSLTQTDVTTCSEWKSSKGVDQEKPFVMVDKNFNSFTCHSYAHDISIFHPDIVFNDFERPSYITNRSDRRRLSDKRSNNLEGYSAVYYLNEYKLHLCKAIPIDIHWHSNGDTIYDLYIPYSGNFILIENGVETVIWEDE
ncbi:MAG: hypothetical protein ACNS60_09730 [Candidatus Cyclobacteriaceae bacterium M2_1C_046]